MNRLPPRIPRCLAALALATLGLACERAAPDLVVQGPCPDGSDLAVRFESEGGVISARSCCTSPGDASSMRKADRPGDPRPPGTTDRMWKDHHTDDPGPPGSADRMRNDPHDGPWPHDPLSAESE